MNTNPNPIAIFKPGAFTATNGMTLDFSEADLLATAKAYDPALHEAPLVIGHPVMDDPAYGWAASLQFADGLLQAQPRDIAPEFAEWVGRKLYKKISAKFYMPDHPGNPVPGVYYLRHIGFLGAQPPAVKGLPDPAFAEDEFLVVEFSEEEMPVASEDDQALAERKKQLDQKEAGFAEREAQLAKQSVEFAEREKKLTEQEKAVRTGELLAFAEEQIKVGTLLPKDKSGCVAFMATLDDDKTVEFAEGDQQKKLGGLAWFQGFVKGLPKSIEFGELSGAKDDKTQGLSESQVAHKARLYHKKQTEAGNSISFAEAVDAVTKGEE